jgi:hypothetical protein
MGRSGFLFAWLLPRLSLNIEEVRGPQSRRRNLETMLLGD